MTRANALSVSGWRPLHEAASGGADTIAKGLNAEVGEELSTLEEAWPRALPQGVIHADLFPDNVFFLDNKVSGVIDFDECVRDIEAQPIVFLITHTKRQPGTIFVG